MLIVLPLKPKHQPFTSPCVTAALTFELLNKQVNGVFFSPSVVIVTNAQESVLSDSSASHLSPKRPPIYSPHSETLRVCGG